MTDLKLEKVFCVIFLLEIFKIIQRDVNSLETLFKELKLSIIKLIEVEAERYEPEILIAAGKKWKTLNTYQFMEDLKKVLIKNKLIFF